MGEERWVNEMGERAKCVVCGEEQVDVEYLGPIPRWVPSRPGDNKRIQTLHIGFPVCYEHQIKDLQPDQYVLSDIIVEVA